MSSIFELCHRNCFLVTRFTIGNQSGLLPYVFNAQSRLKNQSHRQMNVNIAQDTMYETARWNTDYTRQLIDRSRRSDSTVDVNFTSYDPTIPNDIKDKILQPFLTTRKGTEGTRLCLSITNDIINVYGGNLNIKASSNEGITFTIHLKLK